MASLESLLHEVRRIEEHREVLTEKKIKSIYQSLIKDLNSFVSEEYIKYSDKDGKMFLSYLDSKNKRAKFLQEIAERVDSISPDVKKQMLDLVDKTYEKTYKGMVSAVKNADEMQDIEIPSSLVRPEVIKKAVANNIDKLTLDSVMEKHRSEIIADIQQTVTLGLMLGDRYETMAKRIQERINVSNSKANNIARTESHRNIESGFMAGAEETAKVFEGSDLIYAATWRTMRDERVRPQQRRRTKNGWKTTISKNGANHQKMEGVTVKAGEFFQLEPDVFAKNPGESGSARNDCNCRCYISYKVMTIEEFAKATGQTPEAVRKKYNAPVKENDLTNTKESDIIELPKSLDNFDEYQEKWVNTQYRGLSAKDKKLVEDGIQSVIDNNAYSMRVNGKDLQKIIDNGFLNQFETGTSGGTLSRADRKTASYRLFGNDAKNMKDSEFEKYGYLGSMDFAEDAKTSVTSQYGRTIVKFDKAKLKGRVTYTIDDSLGNALYNEVIGGKIGDQCSVSGVPIFNMDDVLDYFKESDRMDIYNADNLAQLFGCRYWELQFHGKLTINDVESICLTRRDTIKPDTLSQLKELGIKVFRLTGGEVREL